MPAQRLPQNSKDMFRPRQESSFLMNTGATLIEESQVVEKSAGYQRHPVKEAS